jgi:hypothetical protein
MRAFKFLPDCRVVLNGFVNRGANSLRQTLKERFGELIPEKIEEIKALRK